MFVDVFFTYFKTHLLVPILPGNAETDFGRGGKVNSRLMASCVRNICTENYYNPVILLQVTVANVEDPFLRQTLYNCTLYSISADADIRYRKKQTDTKLLNHVVPSVKLIVKREAI